MAYYHFRVGTPPFVVTARVQASSPETAVQLLTAHLRQLGVNVS